MNFDKESKSDCFYFFLFGGGGGGGSGPPLLLQIFNKIFWHTHHLIFLSNFL